MIRRVIFNVLLIAVLVALMWLTLLEIVTINSLTELAWFTCIIAVVLAGLIVGTAG